VKIIKIIVDEIPENCLDCELLFCQLPKYARDDRILKKYWNKRHEDCPLELEESK
jgi:hypothetical protein